MLMKRNSKRGIHNALPGLKRLHIRRLKHRSTWKQSKISTSENTPRRRTSKNLRIDHRRNPLERKKTQKPRRRH